MGRGDERLPPSESECVVHTSENRAAWVPDTPTHKGLSPSVNEG